MYGKLFESMYDGTLADDWRALITFQQLIIICDADGVVDITPAAISRRTGIPIEHIKAGIEVLENPDPYSRTPGEDGKRIKIIDDHKPWGWYIVNHNKYKTLQDYDKVREQNRERKRKQRERDKGKTSRNVTQCHASSRHTDTDTDIKNKQSSNSIESDLFDSFWKSYPRKEAKKKAELIFKKLSKTNRQRAIADSSKRYTNTEKQFIPLASTYLNGERWNDELTVHGAIGYTGISNKDVYQLEQEALREQEQI